MEPSYRFRLSPSLRLSSSTSVRRASFSFSRSCDPSLFDLVFLSSSPASACAKLIQRLRWSPFINSQAMIIAFRCFGTPPFRWPRIWCDTVFSRCPEMLASWRWVSPAAFSRRCQGRSSVIGVLANRRRRRTRMIRSSLDTISLLGKFPKIGSSVERSRSRQISFRNSRCRMSAHCEHRASGSPQRRET